MDARDSRCAGDARDIGRSSVDASEVTQTVSLRT